LVSSFDFFAAVELRYARGSIGAYWTKERGVRIKRDFGVGPAPDVAFNERKSRTIKNENVGLRL